MSPKANAKTGEIVPVTSSQLIADPDAQPVLLAEVLEQMGMSGPRIPAKELIGHTLTIHRAKPFMSSFNEDNQAWFCVCKDHDTNAQITTVLGGGAVVDILEAYAASGQGRPLTVTLQWIEGGRFGGYYQLA